MESLTGGCWGHLWGKTPRVCTAFLLLALSDPEREKL